MAVVIRNHQPFAFDPHTIDCMLLTLANEAKNDQLAAKREKLKSSVVKVYLTRG